MSEPVLARQARLRQFLSVAAAVAGCAGAAVLLAFVDHISSIRHWLLWDLLTLWGWQLFLAAACLSTGHLLVTRVFGMKDAAGLEVISLSIAAGFVTFGLGMYLGGFLRLFGPVFAVLWPAIMLAAGARAALPAVRHAIHWWRESPAQRPSLVAMAAGLFGVVCILLLYLGVMSPDAVNYDAAWYHLTIAQDYAREGRIVWFPADWVKCLQHFGSVVNTWSFIVPGLRAQPLRWMMALHTEFAFLLWTPVTIAALVRWLLGDRPPGPTWVVFFLFPGIFVYDSNLGGAADHFLAFLTAPLFLACMRAASTLDPRAWALAGTLAAGAILTKLQAIYLLTPLALVMVVMAAHRTLADRRAGGRMPSWRQLLAGPAVAVGCTLVFSAVHFGKNWVFYGNPVYPFLQRVFTGSRPAVPDAALLVDTAWVDWRWHAPAALGERLTSTLEMLFTFSFKPHYSFVNNLPVFGNLFTLSLLFLPFVARARRLWAGTFVSLGALFIWAFSYRVDRNLQTLAPILAATTAAILVTAAKLGRLARVGVAALVFAQLAWGGDLLFNGFDRVSSAVALIRSSYEGRAAGRYKGYRQAYVTLGRALPSDAVVVMHNAHGSLGINRRVYLDWMGFQALIDYRAFRTPRDMWQRFHDLGVTHIVSQPRNRSAPTKQEEAIFAAFHAFAGGTTQSFSGLELMPMPAAPPPMEAPYEVLALGIGSYADGVYGVEDLGTCEEMPPRLQHYASPRTPVPDTAAAASALARVKIVLLGAGRSMTAAGDEILRREFRSITGYGGFTVYVRGS